MGGRSRNQSNKPKPVDTAALQQKGADQQDRVASGAERQYGNLQTAMVGKMFPAFGELIKGGMESFGNHPMGNIMGAALGMPIQMKTPGVIDEFISKYRPQEPAAPVEQAPQQQPYNVNDDMRARMGMGSPYGATGPYGQPNIYNVGGVRR